MHFNSFPGIVLIALVFSISACHAPHDGVFYHTSYVEPGEYQYIYYDFNPYETYRITLSTYSGDADIAVYSDSGELVVYSYVYPANTDEVIFTAANNNYHIEIYGNHGSDYDLYIENLPYYDTGLSTDADGIEFNIDSNTFTGINYSILATNSFQVSHVYDSLKITPLLNPDWLDVTPTGTINNTNTGNDNIAINVNILETTSTSAKNYASVIIQAQDYYGKVNVFREVDIVYRVI